MIAPMAARRQLGMCTALPQLPIQPRTFHFSQQLETEEACILAGALAHRFPFAGSPALAT